MKDSITPLRTERTPVSVAMYRNGVAIFAMLSGAGDEDRAR